MTIYAWSFESRVYHVVSSAGRGWKGRWGCGRWEGHEVWVDRTSERPPADREPCECCPSHCFQALPGKGREHLEFRAELAGVARW